MNPAEGVIKYHLKHQTKQPSQQDDIKEINSLREIMYRLRVIGQNPSLYQGYGYGNISQRYHKIKDAFMISGTQTGHLKALNRENYCLVTDADPKLNQLSSQGICKPSSEALTHAMIYQNNAAAQFVIHIHCAEIWTRTTELNIPYTPQTVAYGTPEMACAIEKLFLSGQLQSQSIISFLGHEDGVIAFGKSAQETLSIITDHLLKALVFN